MSSFHAKRNGPLRTLVRVAVVVLLLRALWHSAIGSAIAATIVLALMWKAAAG